jgi:dipeptidyl aminopeptidase/acylaminoacyl peptidase
MAHGTNYGQLDIRQIKEGIDYLVAQGAVDPERVGVTGCSYGGYFTLQSLRTYPELYAAANPQCSLVDLTEEFTFGYTPFVSYLMGRSPLDNPAEYLRDSPFYGTNGIETPTLIFHGTDDFLPVALINNVHDQIEANGTPVKMLRVKGEGHGFGLPTSQMYAAQEQLLFFRQYLAMDEWVPPEPHAIYLPFTIDGDMP